MKQIGKPIKRDDVAKNRDDIQFAIVMVEVIMSLKLAYK